MKGKLSTRIWLIAGFLFVGLLLLIRQNLSRDAADLSQVFKISSDNFLYNLAPRRSYPINLYEKEVLLKTTFGEPFISFRLEDWKKFWNVIYGIYEPDAPLNLRLPPRARQLTIPEMQDELARVYPQIFSNFNEQYWQEFWKLLKIKK